MKGKCENKLDLLDTLYIGNVEGERKKCKIEKDRQREKERTLKKRKDKKE